MERSSTNVVPVILCGGSGSRLWPLSRTGFPKQFLCLTGEISLFQQVAMRLALLGSEDISISKPIIVTGENHRFLATEQLREINISLGSALIEPASKNTAPALTLAALAAQAIGEDPVLIVTPADQTVSNGSAFAKAIHQAIYEAVSGSIVVFGVVPDRPETGYGYIHATAIDNTFNVKEFIEKPNASAAQHYFDMDNYFWNSGIVVLKASVWLQAIQLFRFDIYKSTCVAWEQRRIDGDFIRPGVDEFMTIPSESIDYAVLEQAPRVGMSIKMIPIDVGWSDLGSWDAVWKELPKDKDSNACVGDVLNVDSSNTLVHASSRLVGLVGVTNLVVIETADAVLVADRARSQDVKHIVNGLSNCGREETNLHRKVHRPWGWYDSIDEGAGFKVKRICVTPGSALSLQFHKHRAEHWIVVSGTAEVTCGNSIFTLRENESTFIPTGQVHRLRNLGDSDLELIEVQSGSYLGEDDIVRLKDNYGRVDMKLQDERW